MSLQEDGEGHGVNQNGWTPGLEPALLVGPLPLSVSDIHTASWTWDMLRSPNSPAGGVTSAKFPNLLEALCCLANQNNNTGSVVFEDQM